jgi:hypothetical protein
MPASSVPGGRTASASTGQIYQFDITGLPDRIQIRLLDRRFRDVFGAVVVSCWN